MNSMQKQHKDFLNHYYGKIHHLYDLSRKYFLFGRDTVLKMIENDRWKRLIEIGPGTGRNLQKLHKNNKKCEFGGIEPCDVMRKHIKNKYPWVKLSPDFAEDARFESLLSGKPDIILFSYSLSMIQHQERSIQNAFNQLAPGGKIYIVDFGNFEKIPFAFKKFMTIFLTKFHVDPLKVNTSIKGANFLAHGLMGYYVIARLDKTF
jgi:S-adenosylmethionine-diacylgycerolhomoserine-N-methlytransferase